MEHSISRGDIYLTDLSPTRGSEQAGVRPVLVIQNNKGNKHSPTVIIAAITSRKKNYLPTHVALSNVSGLGKGSMVLLEQLRTFDKQRLGVFIGKLSKREMKNIDNALAISVGLKS